MKLVIGISVRWVGERVRYDFGVVEGDGVAGFK